MIAGSSDPLFDDWLDAIVRDPAAEWQMLWSTVAGRAKSLAEDSPECAALVKSKLLRIHGPTGLKLRSLYQSDDAPDTSSDEIETRRRIERAISFGAQFIDASGIISRAEFDWQMSWNACVLGDAFAVRVWQDGTGPTSTRWRIVHPARVCAPEDKRNDPRFAGGIERDANGRRVALWVLQSALSDGGIWKPAKPERIQWTAEDGTPNVVFKTGLRMPGSLRGLSEFAPIMLPARMLQGVTTAYVATKRVQASHPMLLHVKDVKKAREAYRGTRIENLLIAEDHKVEFPAWKFEGDDYREFIDTAIRSLCAAWQVPWELVMGDHSAKSGASSRSLWQAHYQMAEREQADHVACVQRPVDESVLREINARNGMGLSDDWHRNMAGIYQGPPRVMPDPQKEIAWAEGMRALGVSRSTILNRFGEDFRDEVMQDRQDAELEAAQNPEKSTPDAPAEPDADDAGAKPSDRPAGTLTIGGKHMALASDLMATIAAIRAQPPQTTINAHITLPESVVATMQTPAPVVHVAAPIIEVNPTPVNVTVAAPSVSVAPPSVTVQAAEPTPVQVNVAAPNVTVENTVEVPQRTVIAEDLGNGRVKMTPQDA